MLLMRTLAAIGAALLLLAAPALGQTPKTKSALTTEIATCFPDNTTGAITPAVARACFLDFLASWQQFASVRAVASTPDTVTTSDYGRVVEYNSAGAVAVQLPAATGSFATFSWYASNIGAGTVTISPLSGTINGASNLALLTGEAAFVVSDGANWHVIRAGFNIGHISGIVLPANGGTGINNGSSTITIGGNVVLAGAFTFTGTLTGTTAITFPTSGTLISSTTTVPADTAKCNPTSGAAAPVDCRIGFLHSKDLGAKGDTTVGNFSVSITSGTKNLTVAGGTFTVADQGKLMTVTGAGAAGATLFTSITTVNSGTSLVVADNAGTTLTTSSQTVAWGTNDTTALQAWITGCQNASAICYLDEGLYAINAAVNVSAAIMTTSPNSGAQSILVPFNGTQVGLNISTSERGGVIADIGWQPFGVQTGGSFINATGGGSFWKFNRLFTLGSNTATGITISNFNAWYMHQVNLGCGIICLNLDGTTFLNDSGDSVLSDSWISPAAANAIGIRMINTGGLKIANTKILSVSSGSRGATWTGTASCNNCSDLFFSNMSVEVIGSGLTMTKGTATGTFGNISITGGEWNTGGTTFDLSDTAGTGFFTNIAISGVATAPQNATAVANFGAVAGVIFGDNTIQGVGTTTQGVTVGTATTNCTLGFNQYFGTITTQLTDNSTTGCKFPGRAKVDVFTSGTSLTYTPPTWAVTLELEMVGGGGGGAGSGTAPAAATAGGNTTFTGFAANGGALGGAGTLTYAAGGTATGCDINLSGGTGGLGENNATRPGGGGGVSAFGGAGAAATSLALSAGSAAAANSGSGGSGSSAGATAGAGGGGGAGGYCRKLITAPATSYTYTIGTAGGAGGAGTGGAAGGAGAAGLIRVIAR